MKVEKIVFGISIATLAALTAWWFVFARQLSGAHYEMTRQYLALTTSDPSVLQERIAALDDRFSHRLVMIASEGATFALLLLVCTAVLFIVARQRRMATERMERVLQFTTHELETPIAGVKALLQSLSLGSIPEQTRAKFLDQGVNECNRLEHLTESILAYQRALARVELDATSGKRLIEEVLEHRAATLGDEGLTTRIDDARVMVDKDAFRVVFENLLDNAKKYGSGKPVEITAKRQGNAWQVEVRDQGIGFESVRAETLFDPFTREKGTAKTHGSGLGLYISRQLALRFGAKLSASSPGPDQGAAFILALKVESG